MSSAFRRQGNRPRLRVEMLEARALLAVAGSLDPSFGAGYGSSTASIGVPINSEIRAGANSVATTPDGHILVMGGVTIIPSTNLLQEQTSTAILEFNANGTLNTSFGTGGEVQLLLGGAMTVLPDGDIIVASATTNQQGGTYAALELNPDGSRNTSFGTDGIAEYPAGTTTSADNRIGNIAAALPLANNQVILAGSSDGGFSAVRLNTDGSLDTTYGTGGTATVTVPSPGFVNGDIYAALQSNGQLILAATDTFGSDSFMGGIEIYKTQIAVTRLNADGSLDTTYGGSTAAGIVLIPTGLVNTGSNFDTTDGLAIQPTTGDLLVSGIDGTSNAIDRLTAGGVLDTTFGTGGAVKTSIGSSDTLQDLAVEADGDIVLVGGVTYYTAPPFNGGVTRNLLQVLQLNPDGTPDASFGNTSTPGLLQTRLASPVTLGGGSPSPAVDPITGDILLPGVAAVGSLTGLTYGLTIDSILPAATTGPSLLAPPAAPPADFTGLGLSDLGVYDVPTGSFLFETTSNVGTLSASAGPYAFTFGIPGAGQTIPAIADYQGIGVSQFAAYLPASGVYAIYPTATSPGLFQQFGMAGAGNSIPTPADYYGTGKDEVAVYMPSIAAFAIMAGDGQPGRIIPFGIPGAGQSIPAPADYYNTGQADIAVYLAQYGEFAILAPGGASGEVIPFGKPGLGQSIPVPGDYDGSGKTELAVYVPSVGAYFYRPANGGNDVEVPIGVPGVGEIPVPGDYDGSGRTEAAIYDPISGFFEYQPANGGPIVLTYLGRPDNNSIPLAASPGTLPEFTNPPTVAGMAIRSNAIVPSSAASSSPGSTSAITLSTASAVPAGPTLASIRVVRTLVNQEAPDPFKTA